MTPTTTTGTHTTKAAATTTTPEARTIVEAQTRARIGTTTLTLGNGIKPTTSSRREDQACFAKILVTFTET